MCLCLVSLCMLRLVVFMLFGTFKRIPRWHFFAGSARKATHLLVCAFVYGFGKWVFAWQRGYLKSHGWLSLSFVLWTLEPIKREDWQIVSSSFSVPTPPSVLLSFSLPLCPFFLFSFFHHSQVGLTFIFEVTFQWCELYNHMKLTSATKSQTQRMFSFFRTPLFFNQAKTPSLNLRV